jgi:hypothetical protein
LAPVVHTHILHAATQQQHISLHSHQPNTSTQTHQPNHDSRHHPRDRTPLDQARCGPAVERHVRGGARGVEGTAGSAAGQVRAVGSDGLGRVLELARVGRADAGAIDGVPEGRGAVGWDWNSAEGG